MIRFLSILSIFLLTGVFSGVSFADSPFAVTVFREGQGTEARLKVRFEVPAQHVLYSDKLSLEWENAKSSPAFVLPKPTTILDKFTQHEKSVFNHSITAESRVPASWDPSAVLVVKYQGCDEANCYFPQERRYRFTADGKASEIEETDANSEGATDGPTDWRKSADQFVVSARGSGFLDHGSFLSFLKRGESGAPVETKGMAFGTTWQAIASVLIILLGGLALNLTPCVLPMIPINLAIMGAGSKAGSRRRGFALGGAYGMGMAGVYGGLGLAVVLTGSKFGTLNSSPWFNVAIGLVFIVMSLAMFDVIPIDFSRFQGATASRGGAGSGTLLLAGSLGMVSALLAGACVAPVVISVLLAATQLYANGAYLGLALPFILGLGMALPWPFAGAGLSWLPKPGRWMARVKHVFGGLIALFAAYYAWMAFGLFQIDAAQHRTAGTTEADQKIEGQAELNAALEASLRDGQPVFIDFWASWCKNCVAMEKATFVHPDVKAALAKCHVVRLRAEKPGHPSVKPVLDYFGAMGLPTYVVLVPKPVEQPHPAAQKSPSRPSVENVGIAPAQAPRSL